MLQKTQKLHKLFCYEIGWYRYWIQLFRACVYFTSQRLSKKRSTPLNRLDMLNLLRLHYLVIFILYMQLQSGSIILDLFVHFKIFHLQIGRMAIPQPTKFLLPQLTWWHQRVFVIIITFDNDFHDFYRHGYHQHVTSLTLCFQPRCLNKYPPAILL